MPKLICAVHWFESFAIQMGQLRDDLENLGCDVGEPEGSALGDFVG